MKLQFDAKDKTGMTVDELAEVIEKMRANGASGSEQPTCQYTMKGKIKKLEVSA